MIDCKNRFSSPPTLFETGGRNVTVCPEAVPWFRRLVTGVSPRRPGFAPRSVQWDLWWTKWHWDKFLSEFFAFPCQCHSTVGSTFPKIKKSCFIHPHPGTDKKAHESGRSPVRRQSHPHNQNTVCSANICYYHSGTFSIAEMLSAYYTL
jgi:hypothetical protein